MPNTKAKADEAMEDGADKHWQDVQEGLDDDLRDDSETFDLTTDSFRAGWLAAMKFVNPNGWGT